MVFWCISPYRWHFYIIFVRIFVISSISRHLFNGIVQNFISNMLVLKLDSNLILDLFTQQGMLPSYAWEKIHNLVHNQLIQFNECGLLDYYHHSFNSHSFLITLFLETLIYLPTLAVYQLWNVSTANFAMSIIAVSYLLLYRNASNFINI